MSDAPEGTAAAPPPAEAPVADAPPASAPPSTDAPPSSVPDAPAPSTSLATDTPQSAPPVESTAPLASVTLAPGGGSVTLAPGSADPVSLVLQYKGEFEATAVTLQSKAQSFQQYAQSQIDQGASSVEPFKAQLLALGNLEGDVAVDQDALLRIFSWSSITILAASVSFVFGSYVAGGLAHFFFGGFALALLACVALPYYSHFVINSGTIADDAELRFHLLGVFSASGFLLGTASSHLYYYSEPLAFVSPLAVALFFVYGAAAVGTSRQKVIIGAAAVSFLAQIAVGIITGLSASYLALALFYAVGTAVVLQIRFQLASNETHRFIAAQVTAFLVAKAVAYLLFASREPFPKEA